LQHDFLWRVHQHVPERGTIAVFNRSHYEDVLVARVEELVPKDVWRARYARINSFEEVLGESGTRVVKIFLQISRAEQKVRFEERLNAIDKQWKFDPDDLDKRRKWNLYRAAYRDALGLCSTAHAPWYVIPADRKWFRRFCRLADRARGTRGFAVALAEAAVRPCEDSHSVTIVVLATRA
jgi:polyphosphate kinase 2 (PPK2 family)